MMTKNTIQNRGFSLIELIIVLAIIGILSVVLFPKLNTYIVKAKTSSDKVNLATLNNSTELYSISNDNNSFDVFDGITTDALRMQLLINEGFLGNLIQPKRINYNFYWHITTQSWIYTNHRIADSTTGDYVFNTLQTSSFVNTGSWSVNSDGFNSSWGYSFIPNCRSNYTISLRAILSEPTSASDPFGGYGILFETYVNSDNKDTGYILQYDRGIGEILIRQRVNGEEVKLIKRLSHTTCPTVIPATKADHWWLLEHTLTLQVAPASSPSQRNISVLIDGTKILDNLLLTTVIEDPVYNYTGLRSWHVKSTFKEMTID